MSSIVIGEDRMKEYLKTVKNIVTDPRFIILYKDVDGENTPGLVVHFPGERITILGKDYLYLGVISFDQDDIEIRKKYIATMTPIVYKHGTALMTLDPSTAIKMPLTPSPKKVNRILDDSDLIDTTPKAEDNQILATIKKVFKHEKIRIKGFRQFFDSPSDFNNIRREITNGNGKISWDRCELLAKKVGYTPLCVLVKNDGRVAFCINSSQELLDDIYDKSSLKMNPDDEEETEETDEEGLDESDETSEIAEDAIEDDDVEE